MDNKLIYIKIELIIRSVTMHKFFLIFVFSIFLNTQPLFSQNDTLNMSVGTAFNSGNILGVYNNLRAQNTWIYKFKTVSVTY